MPKESKYTKDLLEPIVEKSDSFRDVVRKLNLSMSGGNFYHIKNRIIKLGIDTSHFTRIKYDRRKPIPLDLVMIKHSPYKRVHLKRRLLAEGLLKNECYICGFSGTWNGKPVVLVLDHVNGISNDHRYKNLRLVCPMCNSQLSTSNSNKKKDLKYIPMEQILSKMSGIEPINNSIDRYCYCGRKLNRKQLEFCSKKCSALSECRRKVKRPSKSQLSIEIGNIPWTHLGKKYGVSDNAVRKWARQYGLI